MIRIFANTARGGWAFVPAQRDLRGTGKRIG